MPGYKDVWNKVAKTSWLPPADKNALSWAVAVANIIFWITVLATYVNRPQEYNVVERKIGLPDLIQVTLGLFAFAFINPAFEEFYWRSFVYESLPDFQSTQFDWKNWITSFSYGSYHFWVIYQDEGYLAGIFVAFGASLFGVI